LPAAVFVVVHLSPAGNTAFASVLNHASNMPTAFATNGEQIRPGHIYAAPPDYHMLVRPGYIELSHGPRENHTRPAIDPTFRTAARAYGSKVTGVVLSGTLGDGSIGLAVVKAYGGKSVVQDPKDALFDSMPRHAIQRAESVDYITPSEEIGPVLVHLTKELLERPARTRGPVQQDHEQWRRDMSSSLDIDSSDPGSRPAVINADFAEQEKDQRVNELTLYTCPDCGGSLWQLDEGELSQFRCHVGHTWSSDLMMVQKSEQLEAALWSVVRLLVEKTTMARQMATRLRAAGASQHADRIDEQAQVEEQYMKIIREQMLEAVPDVNAQIDALETVSEPDATVTAATPSQPSEHTDGKARATGQHP
jgi:two-component system chemotaxis response regulator CheB